MEKYMIRIWNTWIENDSLIPESWTSSNSMLMDDIKYQRREAMPERSEESRTKTRSQ